MSEQIHHNVIRSNDAASVTADFIVDDKDLEMIREFGVGMHPKMQKYVDDFYLWLEQKPYFQQFFPTQKRVDRTKKLQMEYWDQFFKGEVDDQYLQSRRYIGEVHARIELPMDIYMSAMNFCFSCCMGYLADSEDPNERSRKTMLALTKLMHMDSTIIADTYAQLTNEKMLEQSKALVEMSTPVTSLWDGILMLPIVGIIDSKRALDVTARVLETISETQSTCFILDISGVAVMDTAVANYLIKVTQATRLMGCETIISGLSPSIAQTIVNLGIDVGDVRTTSTLHDALRLSFKKINIEVSLSS